MCKDAAGNRAIVAHSAPLCMRVVRHIFVVRWFLLPVGACQILA